MGNPKRIDIGDAESGGIIRIEYVKSKKRFNIFGFTNFFPVIEGGSVPLADFCKQLGITQEDLPKRKEKSTTYP